MIPQYLHHPLGRKKCIVYTVLFEPMELYCLCFVATVVPANASLLLLEAQIHCFATCIALTPHTLTTKAREKRTVFAFFLMQ